MPLHKNQIIDLSIESISSDGNGVGRHQGQVVFVPGAAAGDLLKAKIAKVNKSHAYAIIHQVVTPGPGRVKPDCPISQSCGGCAFRHLSYAAELEAKRGFVADALSRIGRLDAEVQPVLPSPLVDRYRNKVQYPVAPGRDGQLTYGFYAARSHRVIPCEDCLLQPEPVNQIARRCAELLAESGAAPYDEAAGKGLVRHLFLRQSHQSGRVLLCLVLTRDALPKADRLVQQLTGEFPQLDGIVLNLNGKNTNVILGPQSRVLHGAGTLEDELAGVPVELDIHSFAQVNSPGAEQLFGVARDYAAPKAGQLLLDLYCGTGVIGLSMARQSPLKELIGVEVVAPALESARRSAAAMGITNARFIQGTAAQAAAALAAEGLRPDIITIDPPRKGADEATLAAVAEMAPARLVMVSCNPATLARDLAFLVKNGYTLGKVQPVDLFPRTKHVECVCLLTK